MRKVFCDLDGVLVDFVGGAIAAHGKTLPLRDVRWNFHSQLGLTAEEFWGRFGLDFWSRLDWTHEGPSLLAHLGALCGDRLAFLSSPCLTDGCLEGKRAWVRNNLPSRFHGRLILASCKEFFASSDALLIDDHDRNVEIFRDTGGRAVLVPRPWNARFAECDDDGRFAVGRVMAEVSAYFV